MSSTTHLAHLGGRLGGALLDFIYPPHCPGCGAWQAADDREALCRACRGQLLAPLGPRCPRCGVPGDGATIPSWGPSHGPCANCAHWQSMAFEAALVMADFAGAAQGAIHALKFSGIKKVGRFLGGCIAAHPELQSGLADLEELVPVPLHPARQRERGYNQAEEIARGLGHALGVPVRTDRVLRLRPTRQQARLAATERIANLAGAFAPHRGGVAPGEGRPIGLVDDVLTTGATFSACAQALDRAMPGARIRAIAVASPFRSPERHPTGPA